MGESVKAYCLKEGRGWLIGQWDFERNKELTPESLTYGSNRRVWWICEKGHHWQASAKSRCTGGTGCPVCSGRRVLKGENDLASVYPELAAQWHPVKNGLLRPADINNGSHRKVWWKCGKGHEWQASVASRAMGSGCPVCAGKIVAQGENDLQSLYPNTALQWHPVKNGGLTPGMVTPYSNRKVWWVCEEGHEYQAAIAARTMHGSGCPYCAGRKVLAGFNDLATVMPRVAAEWDPDLNEGITPDMVTAGSRKKVWWRCSCGHVWKAVISSRTGTRRSGCPVCAGNVRMSKTRRYAAMSYRAPPGAGGMREISASSRR